MFKPIKGGSFEVIDGNFKCQIPPLGYGVNVVTGELEEVEIIKRSDRKKDQYWERQPLPEWYKEKRKLEERRQDKDKEYFDEDCELYRQKEWKRRLCGVWVYINGKPIYITGIHYLYINWWTFQGKNHGYRDPDRKFFYVWRYCEDDPDCLGLIEITKRKQGKTARGGLVLYEYISRTNSVHGGIQSKTGDDAEEVFKKAVIRGWKKLPHFFRPTFDTTQGDDPKNELRFFKPSVRGAKALLDDDSDELESWIDYKSSSVEAYDGPELHRYLSDEAGKLIDVSIVERHQTVMFCSEVDGVYIGKQLYTTTVEDMDSGGGEFLKLVTSSDFNDRPANNRTNTGLYTYFLPAQETMNYDIYGMPDIEKNMDWFLKRREGYAIKKDDKGLASFIRKNPFTLKEAFKIDGDKCLYNSIKLDDRNSFLAWNKQLTERGNFLWIDSKVDTSAMWHPNPNGRWEIPINLLTEIFKKDDWNKVDRSGSLMRPLNTHKYISATDSYDHNTTEDAKNSMAASFVKSRSGKKYICKYHARPPVAAMVYEDMILQSVFFGCQMLPESNKPGIINHFQRRGYGAFLVQLPGYKECGIPSTQDNKREASLMVEAYIEEQINQIDYSELIDQLLRFDIKKTEPFDLVMAMLWTEYADNYRYFDLLSEDEGLIEADSLFRQYEFNANDYN